MPTLNCIHGNTINCPPLAVEATLRGDFVPPRVDSISVDAQRSVRPNGTNGGGSRPIMKQRNLPPIPAGPPEVHSRSHPLGISSVPPPSVTRVPSNGGEQINPQLPPPRNTRRPSNSTTQTGPKSSTSPVPPTITSGPPVPVRPSASSKPQAPPRPGGNRTQKPPISSRPKPLTSKPLIRTPSRPSKPDNLTLDEKIQKIHDDAPCLIECVEQMRPGMSHQLEDFAVIVDSIITEANTASNDSSVQFKRHLAALRSQTGYLRDPSLHNDIIKLVKVIEMIVTKSQQLSPHFQ